MKNRNLYLTKQILSVFMVITIVVLNVLCLTSCDIIDSFKKDTVVNTSNYYIEPNLVTHIDNGMIKYEALLPKISSKDDVTFPEYVTSVITNEARTYLEEYTKEATQIFEDYKTSVEQEYEEDRQKQIKQINDEYRILFVDLKSLVDDTKKDDKKTADKKEEKAETKETEKETEETDSKEESSNAENETVEEETETETTVEETEKETETTEEETVAEEETSETDVIEGFTNTKKAKATQVVEEPYEYDYLFSNKETEVSLSAFREMPYYADITDKDKVNKDKYRKLQDEYVAHYNSIENSFSDEKIEEEIAKFEPVEVGSKYVVKSVSTKFISIYVQEYIMKTQPDYRIQTYNLDLQNKRIMHISEYLGENYKEKILTAIKSQIDAWTDEEKSKLLNQDLSYIDNLIDETTMFYINNNNELYICFNKFDILVESAGLVEFLIK